MRQRRDNFAIRENEKIRNKHIHNLVMNHYDLMYLSHTIRYELSFTPRAISLS